MHIEGLSVTLASAPQKPLQLSCTFDSGTETAYTVDLVGDEKQTTWSVPEGGVEIKQIRP